MNRLTRNLLLIAVVSLCLLGLAWGGGSQAWADNVAHDAPSAVEGGELHGSDHSSDHGEEKGLLEHNIDPTLFIWNIVLFVAFFAVLAIFVWPKILGGLKAREGKIRRDLNAAEQQAKEASATLDQYKNQLAEAQQEAGKVVAEARVAAEQVAAKIKSDAEAHAAQLRDRNAAEIESAKEQALSDIYAQTADISTQIASKILKREISAADQAQLVSDSLAELTSRN